MSNNSTEYNNEYNIYKSKINDALCGLKDFQRKTVEYVYEQLYIKHRSKMLIADEVGLGKTIVAKGIIAKAFENYIKNEEDRKGNPTFNVIYICSNLALAAQNIRKLNFLGDPIYVEDTLDRLIYLAYKPDGKPRVFCINSLTPGTSFDEKSSKGRRTERAIIFRLLTEYEYFKRQWNGLRWLLKGNVRNIASFDGYINELWNDNNLKIRSDLFGKFRNALVETKITEEHFPKLFNYLKRNPNYTFWHGLQKVCCEIDGRNHHTYDFQGEIISRLRRILSRLCLEYLNADIFILDEFQRYNNLIKLDDEAENQAIELARAVFEIPNAKILMLSATPFKPFTNDFDEMNGEIHYKEFESVLKFLVNGEDEVFWEEFQKDRKAFFSFLRRPDTLNKEIDKAVLVKSSLENKYRKALVRTERLMASEDRNSLIKSLLKDKALELEAGDISEFVNIDKLVLYMNTKYNAGLQVPLEYVKSSPFVLTFLDNYQHKKKLEHYIAEDDELKELLKKTKRAWLDLDKIRDYKSLLSEENEKLPNAKLRLLLEESIENGGWKYLWTPPTLTYYTPEGAYLGSEGYSKTLVFSSWLLVPRMISTVVSYEAERLTVGSPESISDREQLDAKRNYFAKRRSPRPQFTFKVEKDDDEPQNMNTFIYTYPSVYLADIYKPSDYIGHSNLLSAVKNQIKNKIKPDLLAVIEKYSRKVESGDWQRWYWAAPLLLDRESKDKHTVRKWFESHEAGDEAHIDDEDESVQNEEHSGREGHFLWAKEIFKDPRIITLPKLNESQMEKVLEYLSNLTLGSPAVCCLRSIKNIFDTRKVEELLSVSYNVAASFITLFNRPESIAVVRITTESKEYLDRVLEYSIDGNLQSMLDEYIFLLMTCENLYLPEDIGEHISDVLSIRTSSMQADDLSTFISNARGETKIRKSLRTHFAVDFGIQKISTAKGNGRQINVRQAFNSPFRPFVLATTSIGQEGLDFHFYCKKIFHWNLPSNPIDFEQREGRIHRYMGLVIRQNIADKYKSDLKFHEGQNIWQRLFKIAEEEKKQSTSNCDLIPYWHTETKSDIRIERYVPIYPFSKDINKYNTLLRVLAFYRLTFGQPRQEELIDALFEGNEDIELNDQLRKLLIDLSPISFLRNADLIRSESFQDIKKEV